MISLRDLIYFLMRTLINISNKDSRFHEVFLPENHFDWHTQGLDELFEHRPRSVLPLLRFL